MVEFKAKADVIIKERWGLDVEHVRSGRTYEKCFYLICGEQGRKVKSKCAGKIYGWPFQRGPWCNSRLKQHILEKALRGTTQYIGIAADETSRFHTLSEKKKSPLKEAGWTESKCLEWCEDNSLLSPIYTDSARGGCWFCHNQGIQQLRLLRKKYQEYWALMLKWDTDSPVTFHADGHTVHDFERRFQMEDDGLIAADDQVFRWSMLDEELNYRLF